MPRYTFHDPKKDEYFELDMSYDEMEEYKRKHPKYDQVFNMNLGDAFRMGIKKPPADFQKGIIGRMKESIPKNKLGNSKFSIPREI